MATLLPAMQGKFGSNDFWIVTMPAKELTERLTIPKEIDGWEEMSIEERYQREIDYNRVRKQIAPYLASDEDRFFGAFIVSVLNGDQMEFQPLGDMVSKIPALYRTAGSTFGFLTLEGNEILVPLDGQHRLAALEFAITGKDEKQKPIAGIDTNTEVAKDVCTVILLRHHREKSRKIFNKVNRYAKSTTKGENLITADDDVIAVIAREDIADDIIMARLINYKSNTLSARSHEFTTLSTLYEATRLVLEDLEGKRIDTQNLPPAQQIRPLKDTAMEFWKTLSEKIDLFSQALHDTTEAGDDKRREIRADFILGKPFGQLCLVHAVVRLREPDTQTGTRLSLTDICGRINAVDWSIDNSLWKGVVMSGQRIMSGSTAAIFAGRFIAYLLGEELTTEERDALQKRYEDVSSISTLPAPMF
jgi:DNA sulfur modification protein DndB